MVNHLRPISLLRLTEEGDWPKMAAVKVMSENISKIIIRK